ncbi:MAG: hypothetical protein ACYST2_06765 [Planctomycetota bacterium]|jgi:hypothetical protein
MADYIPKISRFKGRDSKGRKNRRIQYVMNYRDVEPLINVAIFSQIREAHNKTKSPLGYTAYRDVAEVLKMPVGRLMQYIKGMHRQDVNSVRFNVNRMGDNVYFKLKC